MEALSRNFFWGATNFYSRNPLIAWKDVCQPKGKGGLGFKNLKTWNQALITKQNRAVVQKTRLCG